MANLSKEIQRGQQAKDFTESDIFTEAFDTIKEEVLQSWANTGESQEREREKLWLMLKMMDKFRRCLELTMETGTLAKEQLKLQREKEAAERKIEQERFRRSNR